MDNRQHERLDDVYRDVYRYAFRMTGRHEEAQDVTQETFARWTARPDTLPRSDVRPWMFVVARNLCLDRLRRASRHPGVALDGVAEPHAKTPGPDEAGMRDELSALIQEAVLDLPPLVRDAMILREYHCYRYAEID